MDVPHFFFALPFLNTAKLISFARVDPPPVADSVQEEERRVSKFVKFLAFQTYLVIQGEELPSIGHSAFCPDSPIFIMGEERNIAPP